MTMIPLRYNVRSLFVRRTTTLAATAGIAIVVFVLASTWMLRAGIQKALRSSGKPEDAVVLSAGADVELGGVLDDACVPIVLGAPGVRHDALGPIGVAEVVFVGAMKKPGGGVTNVLWRGVQDDVTRFRGEIRVVAGRLPRPGTDEAMAGAGIRGRIEGVDLGQAFSIDNRRVAVVGIFEAAGESYESEIWMGRDVLRQAFHREGTVSSVRVRLESPAAFEAFRAAVESDARLGLSVTRETTYYEKASEGAATAVGVVGVFVSLFLSVGAGLGAVITMHAAVERRRREIGVMRALGFSRASILGSFVVEAVAVALLGGVAGAVLSLPMAWVRVSTVNFATFSETVVSFQPTLGGTLGALGVAVVLGVFGGLLPAIDAARVPPLDAARS